MERAVLISGGRVFITLMISFVSSQLLAFQTLAFGQTLDEEKAVKVKAAYLYSFSKFVTWPTDKFPEQSTPIQLGILSDDAKKMKTLLDSVAGSRGLIQNRELKITILEYTPPLKSEADPGKKRQLFVETIRQCHMLFVDQSNKKMREDIFELINQYRVLSIGGGDGFVKGGGMVSLVRKGEYIVFQVNVTSVDAEKLTISPKFLRNAILIR